MCCSWAAPCAIFIIWRWWPLWMRRSSARMRRMMRRAGRRPGGGERGVNSLEEKYRRPYKKTINEIFYRIRPLFTAVERDVFATGERQDVLEGIYASVFGDRDRIAGHRGDHLCFYGCGIGPSNRLSAGQSVHSPVYYRADRAGYGDP